MRQDRGRWVRLASGWASCLVASLAILMLGCEVKPAPSLAASKPSLEASSSKERLDAVKEAGEKYGAKP